MQTKQLDTLDIGQLNSLAIHKPLLLSRLASSVRHLQFGLGDFAATGSCGKRVRELLRACPVLTTITIHSLELRWPVLPREVAFLLDLRVPIQANGDFLRELHASKLQKVQLKARSDVLWPFLATNMQLKEAELETCVTLDFGIQLSRMPDTTFRLHCLPGTISCLQGLCNIVDLTLEKPVSFNAAVVATLDRLERFVLVAEAWIPYFLAPLCRAAAVGPALKLLSRHPLAL